MIARASSVVTYPARFTLVAAMNPCPCGYAGDGARVCVCSENDVHRYRSRLSGPLLDRIDLHVLLPRVPLRELTSLPGSEDSTRVRTRVDEARVVQHRRYGNQANVRCNAQASGRAHLRALTSDARGLLDAAAESLALSARAYHRVVKVARTIADLVGETAVADAHIAEAIRYRPAFQR